jgi:hypothetical protein
MKLYLIKMPCQSQANLHIRTPFGYDSDELFTINKWYDGEEIFDDEKHVTLTKDGYVVRCDDGFIRKVGTEYFITQEEWREKKLNELGI